MGDEISNVEWMRMLESAEEELRQTEKKLKHQKYKRCLDKADLCEARYDEEDVKVNECGASWEYISKEMKYWERWHKRWLELAEKLKEEP